LRHVGHAVSRETRLITPEQDVSRRIGQTDVRRERDRDHSPQGAPVVFIGLHDDYRAPVPGL